MVKEKKLREKFEKPSYKTRHSNVGLRRSLGRKSVGDESINWSDLEKPPSSFSSPSDGSMHLPRSSLLENINVQDDPQWFRHLGPEHTIIAKESELTPKRRSSRFHTPEPNILPQDSFLTSSVNTQAHLQEVAQYVNESVVISPSKFVREQAKEKQKQLKGLLLGSGSNSPDALDDSSLTEGINGKKKIEDGRGVRIRRRELFTHRQTDRPSKQVEEGNPYQPLFEDISADDSDAAGHHTHDNTSHVLHRGVGANQSAMKGGGRSAPSSSPENIDPNSGHKDDSSIQVGKSGDRISRILRNKKLRTRSPSHLEIYNEALNVSATPQSAVNQHQTAADVIGLSREEMRAIEDDVEDESGSLLEIHTKRKSAFSRLKGQRKGKQEGRTSMYDAVFEESDASESRSSVNVSPSSTKEVHNKDSERSNRRSRGRSASTSNPENMKPAITHNDSLSFEGDKSGVNMSRIVWSKRSRTRSPSNLEIYNEALNVSATPQSAVNQHQTAADVIGLSHEEMRAIEDDVEDESGSLLEIHTKRKSAFSRLKGQRKGRQEGRTSMYDAVFEESDASESRSSVNVSPSSTKEVHNKDSERSNRRSRSRSASTSNPENMKPATTHNDSLSFEGDKSGVNMSRIVRSKRSRTRSPSNLEIYNEALNVSATPQSAVNQHQTAADVIGLSHEEMRAIEDDVEDECGSLLEIHTKRKSAFSRLKGQRKGKQAGRTSMYDAVFEESDASESRSSVNVSPSSTKEVHNKDSERSNRRSRSRSASASNPENMKPATTHNDSLSFEGDKSGVNMSRIVRSKRSRTRSPSNLEIYNEALNVSATPQSAVNQHQTAADVIGLSHEEMRAIEDDVEDESGSLLEIHTKRKSAFSRLKGQRKGKQEGRTSMYDAVFEESDASESRSSVNVSPSSTKEVHNKDSERSNRRSRGRSASASNPENMKPATTHNDSLSFEGDKSGVNMSRIVRSKRSRTRSPSDLEIYKEAPNVSGTPQSAVNQHQTAAHVIGPSLEEERVIEDDVEDESGSLLEIHTKRKSAFSRLKGQRKGRQEGRTSMYDAVFEESDASESRSSVNVSPSSTKQVRSKDSERSNRRSRGRSASTSNPEKIKPATTHNDSLSFKGDKSGVNMSRIVRSKRSRTRSPSISRTVQSRRSNSKSPSDFENVSESLNVSAFPQSIENQHQTSADVIGPSHEEGMAIEDDVQDKSGSMLELQTKRKNAFIRLKGQRKDKQEGRTSIYDAVFDESDASESRSHVNVSHINTRETLQVVTEVVEGGVRRGTNISAQSMIRGSEIPAAEQSDEESGSFKPTHESTRLDVLTPIQSPRPNTNLVFIEGSGKVAKPHSVTGRGGDVQSSMKKRISAANELLGNSGKLQVPTSKRLRVDLLRISVQNKAGAPSSHELEASGDSSYTNLLVGNQNSVRSQEMTRSRSLVSNITPAVASKWSNSRNPELQSELQSFRAEPAFSTVTSSCNISPVAVLSSETETSLTVRGRQQVLGSKSAQQMKALQLLENRTQEGHIKDKSVRGASLKRMSVSNVHHLKDVSEQQTVSNRSTSGFTSPTGKLVRTDPSQSTIETLTSSDTPLPSKGISHHVERLSRNSRKINHVPSSSLGPRSSPSEDISESSSSVSSESNELPASNAPGEQALSFRGIADVWTENPLYDIENSVENHGKAESNSDQLLDSDGTDSVFSPNEEGDFVDRPEPAEESGRSLRHKKSPDIPKSSKNLSVLGGSKSPSQQQISAKLLDQSKQDQTKADKLTEKDIQEMQVGLKSWLAGVKEKHSNQPDNRVQVTAAEIFKKPLKPAPKPRKKADALFFNKDGTPYRKPRLAKPKPYVNTKLYKFLVMKLNKKYGLSSEIKAEEFVKYLCSQVTFTIRRKKGYHKEVQDLLDRMVQLGLVKTRFEFYLFIEDFLPMEFRRKAIPSTNNKYAPEPVDDVHAPLSKGRTK